MSEQTNPLSVEVRDLLAAIHDALDIPTPANPENRGAHDDLIVCRVSVVTTSIDSALSAPDGSMTVAERAEVIRDIVAKHYPVTYTARDQQQDGAS